ncbi:hypothetical protein C7974DRAFT_218602 [Boeremia exigua]|uniref:uncharacterized protein n=1 Tax=Boeremia exigua TaxID=749465 RepID=UPI001E8CC34B|nr:uncharacterized protein C7974DRAFT_218602 [Boeremia exigua]KAH6622239.1 hypothetical protein C7974DRAFT_218602 [Boeremia exigua]
MQGVSSILNWISRSHKTSPPPGWLSFLLFLPTHLATATTGTLLTPALGIIDLRHHQCLKLHTTGTASLIDCANGLMNDFHMSLSRILGLQTCPIAGHATKNHSAGT